MRLAALALLTGCNALLGFGDPTLAPPDASATSPSCATGWTLRTPIAIHSDSPTELHDYQLMIVVDTAAMIARDELQPDARDLQFTTGSGALAHAIESGLQTSTTVVWIRVPVIPPGASTLDMYSGKPLATAVTASPFEQGIIENASFEEVSGWTVDPPAGTQASIVMPVGTWRTDGAGSVRIDLEVNGERNYATESVFSQPVVFPAGSDYVIRLDLDVAAASNGGLQHANDGAFLMKLGHFFEIWRLEAVQNITGPHVGQESIPFGPGSVPISIGASVFAGAGTGYAKGYFDNLRVRKHVSPEPTAVVGGEAVACSP